MDTIFELLVDAYDEENDTLAKDFCLPDEKPEEEVRFAPGAMDGILFYHTRHEMDQEAEGFLQLRDALEYANADNYDQAIESVYEFAQHNSALSFANVLTDYVVDNQDRLQPENIYHFALLLMVQGVWKEAVKVGMILLERFDNEEDEDIQEIIRLFGICDEFSLYSGFLMRHWAKADEELFEMAKRVRGWGRIHAIRMLQNVDADMQEWLVLNGVDNDIMPAYSGLDVYEKIDYLTRIVDNNLSLQEYRGLAHILEALLDEGPVIGISQIDNREEVIDAFLEMTVARHDLEAEDLRLLLLLANYLEQQPDEQAEELYEDIELFLMSDRVRTMIEEAVKEGRCVEELAQLLDSEE